jgi:hypothetical protein
LHFDRHGQSFGWIYFIRIFVLNQLSKKERPSRSGSLRCQHKYGVFPVIFVDDKGRRKANICEPNRFHPFLQGLTLETQMHIGCAVGVESAVFGFEIGDDQPAAGMKDFVKSFDNFVCIGDVMKYQQGINRVETG